MVVLKVESKLWRRLILAGIVMAYCGYFIKFLIQGYDPVIQILPYFSWAFT
jgi:hypothetical protein